MTLADLRDRLDAAECGKHDQVIVLIEACLSEKSRPGREIVRTVSALGFDKRHVGIQLQRHTGLNVERHRWFKDTAGRYHLLT